MRAIYQDLPDLFIRYLVLAEKSAASGAFLGMASRYLAFRKDLQDLVNRAISLLRQFSINCKFRAYIERFLIECERADKRPEKKDTHIL